MPEPIGTALFPGIRFIKSAAFTLSHGISPSVCNVELAPQPDFAKSDGPLVFKFRTITLTFPDCHVDLHSIARTEQGRIWRLSILDRRWKWRYLGGISGSYNVRFQDQNQLNSGGGLVGNSLDPDYKMTAQELAVLCLDAMGETSYDVSQLPDDTYPEVNWDNVPPAQALQDLVEPLGCRVILTLTNSVLIGRVGFGASLPNLPVLEDALTIDPPERPDALAVVCGKNRYQVDFLLEPVGMDTDGTIKNIQYLSYAPTDKNNNVDWSLVDPEGMFGVSVTPTVLGKIPWELARQTVWRWYRICLGNTNTQWSNLVYSKDGPAYDKTQKNLQIAGYGTVSKLKYVLPIEDVQVRIFVDYDGQVKSLPAWIFGIFVNADMGWVNTQPTEFYARNLSVDTERGIVQFAEPVWMKDANNKPAAAQIFLRCATSIKDPITFAYNKLLTIVPFADYQNGTEARILKHDEIVLNTIPQYALQGVDAAPNGAPIISKLDNSANITNEINYYIQAAALEYQVKTPQQKHYPGLIPISPDGAIQQVTFTVSDEHGCTTHASRNNEHNYTLPSYRERRLYEDTRDRAISQLKQFAAKAGRTPFNQP